MLPEHMVRVPMPALLLALGVAGCGPQADRGVDLGFPDGQVARATLTDAYVHPPVVAGEKSTPWPHVYPPRPYPDAPKSSPGPASIFCSVSVKPHRARVRILDPDGSAVFHAESRMDAEHFTDSERRVPNGFLACLRWSLADLPPLHRGRGLRPGIYQWQATFEFDTLPSVSVARAFRVDPLALAQGGSHGF